MSTAVMSAYSDSFNYTQNGACTRQFLNSSRRPVWRSSSQRSSQPVSGFGNDVQSLPINTIFPSPTMFTLNEARNQTKLSRSYSEPDNKSNSSDSTPSSPSTHRPPTINSSRYKTEKCRPFDENGYCKYGEKCQFAHGNGDLRSLQRHPKYKTDLCRTFHTVGFCPYGPRCHFVHEGNPDDPAPSELPPATPSYKLITPSNVFLDDNNNDQVLNSTMIPQNSITPPINVRPKALNFDSVGSPAQNLVLAGGSLGNSPTSMSSYSGNSSASNSPIPFSGESFVDMSGQMHSAQHNYGFIQPYQHHQAPATAPVLMSEDPFHFGQIQQQTVMYPPLNIQTDPMADIVAELQKVALATGRPSNYFTSRISPCGDDLFATPPSPPNSVSGDSVSSRSSHESGGRLEVFTRIASESDDRA